jgi:serine/threonine protein kinase
VSRVGEGPRPRDTLNEQVTVRTRSQSHGRYTIVRKLAEGGMAEIFLGRQHGSEGFHRQVVLKRIHTAFLADAQFRNMLVDEAHISMGLHHNNIVQILDLGRAGGRLFLVLELVDGWDLARILERTAEAKFPLPVGLGLYLIAEVCRALSYAHGRTDLEGRPMGIVHRDVSPQNVLVSDQGEVKLTDFGIAKAMTKRERTATGVVKGKIAFMSPEQACGQPLDGRSDLFSLGTLLYLVSTGVRPFEAATDFEIFARVQKGIFTPPEDVRPELSPALAQVIRRAMSVDPEQRYQTADELLVDIEGIWRTEFSAPGSTELKLWLVELGRRDGVPTIARTRAAKSSEPSGDLTEGQAVVLGEEGSADYLEGRLEGGVDSDLDTDMALGRLDTIAAHEAARPTSEPTFIAQPGELRPGTRAGRNARPGPSLDRITGTEETSMHDLALRIGDESSETFRPPVRAPGRTLKFGFVAFLLITLGAAAVAWRLAGAPETSTRGATPDRGRAGAAKPTARSETVVSPPAAARPEVRVAPAPVAPPGPPTALSAPAPAQDKNARDRQPPGRRAAPPSTAAWSPMRRPTGPISPEPAPEILPPSTATEPPAVTPPPAPTPAPATAEPTTPPPAAELPPREPAAPSTEPPPAPAEIKSESQPEGTPPAAEPENKTEPRPAPPATEEPPPAPL